LGSTEKKPKRQYRGMPVGREERRERFYVEVVKGKVKGRSPHENQ